MNKMVSIGYMGIKRCYLNVDKDEAIRRFLESEGLSKDEFETIHGSYPVQEFEFDSEFGAYEVWSHD